MGVCVMCAPISFKDMNMEALENSKIKVFASKKTDDWKTPSYIYEQITAQDVFDPCPFQSDFDGLAIDWKKYNFVNPPYSQLGKWVDKCIEQRSKGNHVLMLIPARTDTKAFQKIFEYGARITFIIGRLRFNDESPAPFPSMLVLLTGSGYSSCTICKRENIIIRR